MVPAVALILGGGLCKLLTLSMNILLDLVKEEIMATPEAVEFVDVILDICKGMIAPFFAEMSKFGITMIGIGVILILAAILRGVLKKNASVADEAV